MNKRKEILYVGVWQTGILKSQSPLRAQLREMKLAGKMPTCPLSSPSHQSYCESVFVMTVMRSPTAKLRSPGCCPVNACMAVTTRVPPDASSVYRVKTSESKQAGGTS